jgi:envelope integrity protein B
MVRRKRAAWRPIAMMFLGRLLVAAAAVGLAATAVSGNLVPRPVAAAPQAEAFASHRAVYDLTLAWSKGNGTIAARGRILYDFSGNACEGYALQFRQVSELNNGEGKSVLSDLRSTTWEDGAAKSFIFKTQSYLNGRLAETIDGKAERQSDKASVTLAKPLDTTFELAANTAFPIDHMRRILAAARAGNSILAAPLYDGSDNGQKIYDTLSVIGHPIAADQHAPTDAAANQTALAGMKRWPVTVSYFDKAKSGNNGEQSPVYSIKFELYENGISRALVLEYSDFAIAGELTSLDIRDSKPCQ